MKLFELAMQSRLQSHGVENDPTVLKAAQALQTAWGTEDQEEAITFLISSVEMAAYRLGFQDGLQALIGGVTHEGIK